MTCKAVATAHRNLSSRIERYLFEMKKVGRPPCRREGEFLSRAEAKVVIEAWRRHYNEVRPHSSLGYLTPEAFAANSNQQLPLPQRAGTLRDVGGFAPRPVATSSLKGQSNSQETPVLSS